MAKKTKNRVNLMISEDSKGDYVINKHVLGNNPMTDDHEVYVCGSIDQVASYITQLLRNGKVTRK